MRQMKKILFVVNDDWFFISHRLPIAIAAMKNGYEVHVATSEYDGDSKLIKYGIEHHTFTLAKAKLAPFSDLNTLIELCKLYRKIRPDIIHHITIKPVIYGGIAARLVRAKAVVNAISGLGVVFIEHGCKAKFRKVAVSVLYKIALGGLNSKVIVQNKDDRNIIMSLANLEMEQIELIKGSGVDLEEYCYTPRGSGKKLRVILLARMLRDKGVYEFYKAACYLKPRNPDVEFILAGDTHDNPSSLSETELKNWNLEGIVSWIGHQEKTKELLINSDVVVLPSYREGLPKSILEASAIGRAVVTTNVPGCRDAILKNRTGLLAPVKNVEVLAASIQSLLDNEELRLELGRNGRIFMEQEFSVEKVVAKHMEIYKKL